MAAVLISHVPLLPSAGKSLPAGPVDDGGAVSIPLVLALVRAAVARQPVPQP